MPLPGVVYRSTVMPNAAIDPAKPLKNQKALVTGANSGIGEACAIGLGEAGASVVVNYLSKPEEAERVVEIIRKSGSEAIAIECDVSREEQVQAMFKNTIETFGTLDILVNNAGLQQDAAFHEMTLKQWNTVAREKRCVSFCGGVSCRKSRAQPAKSSV
jgi:glucose 1-dehydrogenase